MRFEDVAARLATLPDTLPPGPRDLIPLVIAGERPPRPPAWATPGRSRDAAVLVLLYPDAAGEALVLLTERPSGDLRHSGEISCPGGAVDHADGSIVAAALREAREEVGLDPGSAGLRVVGQLDPVDIPVSGFHVVPVLAVADRRPRLVGDAREVAAILEVPLAHFVPPAPVRVIEEDRGGWRLRYGAYEVAGHTVWGATARILGQLGAVLAA